jgi:hypothetical protein
LKAGECRGEDEDENEDEDEDEEDENENEEEIICQRLPGNFKVWL